MLHWTKLNTTFDAEPNAPEPRVEVNGDSVRVRFFLNPFVWADVEDGDEAVLTFTDVYAYRLGPTNDEGFYRGQCRFARSGIQWGDFYELKGSAWQTDFPADRKVVRPAGLTESALKHYLFYFRDEAFECVASSYQFAAIGR